MPLENPENKEALNFTIDLARDEDLEKINEINNCPEEHLDFLDRQKRGELKFFVIRVGDEIAGYVGLYFDHQSAHFSEIKGPYLEGLVVNPKFRKKGLGKRLLEICEKEIKDAGGHDLTLAVLSTNQRALNFYKGSGYQEIPDTKFEPPKNSGQEKTEYGYYLRKKIVTDETSK